MFQLYSDLFRSDSFILVFKTVYWTAPVWVPALLIFTAWELWVRYVRGQFIAKQKYVLLEIKLPKDVFKSPAAAEFFINNLHQTAGEKNWFVRHWKGSVRAWSSLEIVSINGSVHFYIWLREGLRNIVEASIYSQYPGVEVYEVPDYTLPISYDPEKIGMWASEFDLTKPDAFPIKTYIDYGMDKNPDEEYKVDPLVPLIEFFGNLSKDSQAWLQILVRAHKSEEKDPKKTWADAKIWKTFRPKDIWDRFEKTDLRWKEAAKKEVEDIIAKAKGERDKEGKIIPGTVRQLTETEKDTITALNRSISKYGFDVGIRAIYFAPKDTYSPANVGAFLSSFKHFNSHLNGFAPARDVEDNFLNFFFLWKERPKKWIDDEKADLLDKYKKRAYYYPPYKSPHFILNSEELATLYHFPGSVSSTPTFARVESRKAEPPANIPI